MTAHEIAKDFIKTMNPSLWDGVGRKPDNFDTRIKTYIVDGFNEYKLNVSYDKKDKLGYVVMFEIRWIDNGERIYLYDIRRINSEDVIEHSIDSLFSYFQ